LANAFTPFSSIISLRTTCTTRFIYKEGTLSMYIRKIGFNGSFCCQITEKNVLAYMGLWVSIIWFHQLLVKRMIKPKMWNTSKEALC
jgi:hypothetical protein